MAAGLELEAEQASSCSRQRSSSMRAPRSAPRTWFATEHVDAIVPGDAVCIELAEQLQAMRPFGMGNPAVRLLLPGARLAELRPMGEGKHARFTINSAGVRARAVAFGVGNTLTGAVGDGQAGRHRPATTSPLGSRSTSGQARLSRGWSSTPCMPLPASGDERLDRLLRL